MKQEALNPNVVDSFWTYITSIDWEEPWLWLLMSFHVLCGVLTSAVLLFNFYRPQIVLFVCYLGLAYASEYINDWAAKNYRKFSKQQYFDSQGMFISLLFSFPLLINAIVIVIFWMWGVMKVMIGLKRARVAHQRRKTKASRKESEKSSADPDSDSKKEDETADTSPATAVREPEQEPEKSKQEKKED